MQIVKKNSNDRVVYTPIRSIFDDFFRIPSIDDSLFMRPSSLVHADMYDDKDNVYIKMALPGMSEEDVKISLDRDVISISAHKKVEDKGGDENTRVYMRSIESSYEQSFNLPCNVDSNMVEAKLKDGIINITLPKSKEDSTKEIKVIKG